MAYHASHDDGGAGQGSEVIEVLGLAARVIFEVLAESVGSWDFSGRPTYRRYLGTVPAGETALSRREWKAAGKPEKAAGSERAT